MEEWLMPLNIKDDQTHELARQLAERKGVSMARAVKDALAEALHAAERDSTKLSAELTRIAIALASNKSRDDHTADEIIGYDERGLPS
jgi:antitoxin VapB